MNIATSVMTKASCSLNVALVEFTVAKIAYGVHLWSSQWDFFPFTGITGTYDII